MNNDNYVMYYVTIIIQKKAAVVRPYFPPLKLSQDRAFSLRNERLRSRGVQPREGLGARAHETVLEKRNINPSSTHKHRG